MTYISWFSDLALYIINLKMFFQYDTIGKLIVLIGLCVYNYDPMMIN